LGDDSVSNSAVQGNQADELPLGTKPETREYKHRQQSYPVLIIKAQIFWVLVTAVMKLPGHTPEITPMHAELRKSRLYMRFYAEGGP
jgi:hypothetical protein